MSKAGDTQPLTQLEFTAKDFDIAHRVAKALGYEQYAYTSTSALYGLFCLPENPETARHDQPTHGACIIKTRELGFLVVQTIEELHLTERGLPATPRALRGRR